MLLALLFAGCATTAPTAPQGQPELVAFLQTEVAALGSGVRGATWYGPAGATPTLAWNVDVELPCASAIKTSWLVELFAANADALDQPLPGIDAVFADAQHPALVHFTPAQRAAAQQALGTASVRRIGEAMITSKGVDNTTYNIAANLVAAHFGGPAALQAKLHARVPEWRAIHCRRYMLADRIANGDNTATARALANVFDRIVRDDVPGVRPDTLAAVRNVLGADAVQPDGVVHVHKSGALDSEPVTRVESGCCGSPSQPRIHVVMLVQDGVPANERSSAGEHLAACANRIVNRLKTSHLANRRESATR